MQMISIRVDKEWLKRLDEWIESQEMKPTRTVAIRAAVERMIAEKPRLERKFK